VNDKVDPLEGQPRPRDAQATKERILAAAATEFAAKGISGARIDEIAERAQTNKRMLYYYFGSKEGLFREVLHRELTARLSHVSQLPGDRVERLVDRQAHHAQDRSYVRLLQWEALEAVADPSPEDNQRAAACHAWVEAVAADQRAGLVAADLDPAQLVLSELALTLIPAVLPQFTRWITGHDPDDPAFLEARQAFLRDFARRYLFPAHPPDDVADVTASPADRKPSKAGPSRPARRTSRRAGAG
jgi:TetR/AcrR family transcriptional regulator